MPEIFTIGHSNRPLDVFLRLLQEHGIAQLADVRKMPRSRYNPQFNSEALAGALQEIGIGYRHWPELGGMRPKKADSSNMGWRNPSFRAYADYMQTPPFQAALQRLMKDARRCPTAIMCAESVPWRCHRSLIADALIAHGWKVTDIMAEGKSKPHTLTSFAKVEGECVTYPSAEPQLILDI